MSSPFRPSLPSASGDPLLRLAGARQQRFLWRLWLSVALCLLLLALVACALLSRTPVHPNGPAALAGAGQAADALAQGEAAAARPGQGVILIAATTLCGLVLGGGALAHWQWRHLARARAQAHQAVHTLDRALASMADGFLLCDADDRVLRWNQRYLALFPWLEPVLAVGVPFRRLAEVAATHVAAAATPAARAAWVEMRVRLHRDPDHSWEQDLGNGCVVHAVERLMPDGGVVSVYHDVTAAERRLAAAKRQAEAANEAKSQFLANMSHELRTPLNAVLGVNHLLQQSDLSPGQQQQVALIERSGQLLLSLINDILDAAHLESGGLALTPVPFSPSGLLDEARSLLQERAEAKGLAFVVTHSPGLPDQLVGDATRLRQVLFNLIGNALKFTEQGSVRVHLGHARLPDEAGRTNAAPAQVRLLLEVADTGIGIAPEALRGLFQPFHQGDGSRVRRHGGSGLGLALTQQIVQRMGGQVRVDSQPGQGSRFSASVVCSLPVAAAPAPPLPHPQPLRDPARPADDLPAPAAPAAQPASPAAACAVASRGLHILAAEDNSVNQMLIQALLEHLGHRVEIVPDGAQALQRARVQAHDLILMDMQMPVMDGTQAARAIRRLPGAAGSVPIVAMTANAGPEDRQACLDAGMDDFVTKPIHVPALQAALERALGCRTASAAGGQPACCGSDCMA